MPLVRTNVREIKKIINNTKLFKVTDVTIPIFCQHNNTINAKINLIKITVPL